MALATLATELSECALCPRLVAWREQVGQQKRAAYRDWEYWARPVPGFGDPQATVLLFGLAPGAHGSNRTGRPFTGDASGRFLYPALHRAGFCNQPQSMHLGDGLELYGMYISAAVRCAPPNNKPNPQELACCAHWTVRELALLPRLQVLIAVGHIAHQALLRHFGLRLSAYAFAHGAEHPLPSGHILLDTYHVSQQNTLTGKLTPAMLDAVLQRAKALSL